MTGHSDAKRVVITVHGIKTAARWQKSVTPILNAAGFTVAPHDFGNFGLLKFARRRTRDIEVERFREFYERLVDNKNYGLNPDDPQRRPSVVAHSFGTYIVAHCMRRHAYVRFDKILLCGCIVDPRFDWSELFARDQAGHVRNLCCMRDRWVPRARLLVRDAGNSGIEGFDYGGKLLETWKRDDCAHSDFFTESDVREDWLSFLRGQPSTFRIVHSRDLHVRRYRTSLLNQANKIDNKAYKDCREYLAQVIPRGLSSRWLAVNDDLYVFLIECASGRLAGYADVLPVTDGCFAEIVEGRKIDPDIAPRDIEPYSPNSALSLYFMSIAVDPVRHKGTPGLDSEPVERLINGIVSKLAHYATHRDVRVRRMAAVGWTAVGQKLCERLGMAVHLAKGPYGYPVYAIDFDATPHVPIKMRHPGIRRLMVVYEKLKTLSQPRPIQ